MFDVGSTCYIGQNSSFQILSGVFDIQHIFWSIIGTNGTYLGTYKVVFIYGFVLPHMHYQEFSCII